MAAIGSRLKSVLSMVKTGVSVPVILELSIPVPITDDAITALSQKGLKISSKSDIAPLVYGTANEQVINALNTLPFVAAITYDEPVSIQLFPLAAKLERQESISVGETVKAIGADDLWNAGISGKGVKVGVIDTGVSTRHDMIKGSLKGTFSAVPDETVEDAHSHGSWCCSAVSGSSIQEDNVFLSGAAPGADLYALKALSDKGTGQMSWVNQCIEKAVIDFKCDILSMSLGSLTDLGGMDPTSKLVNEVTSKYGTICVIAAGNSFSPMTIGSPGGAIGALTVGSVAMNLPMRNVVSTFSSKGPTTTLVVKPEVATYGGNIIAPNISELIFAAGAFGSYTSMAGTSMATPQVAGALALLKQAKPDLSRLETEQLLAESNFPHAKDTLTGYGTINIAKMYALLDKPRLPLTELEKPLQILQSISAIPLAIRPKTKAEREQMNIVRLPVIRAVTAS